MGLFYCVYNSVVIFFIEVFSLFVFVNGLFYLLLFCFLSGVCGFIVFLFIVVWFNWFGYCYIG